MAINKILFWVCSTLAAGVLSPIVCLSHVPIGLAQEAADFVDAQGEKGEDVDRLAKEANQLKQAGNYVAAAKIWEKILSLIENSLGRLDIQAGHSSLNLAELYMYQGSYQRAEAKYQKALMVYKKNSDEDKMHFATALHGLGNLYRIQGFYGRSQSLAKQASALVEKLYGPNHFYMARSLNHLAILNSSQGLYAKAESLYVRSLGISEKALGLNHIDVATKLNNLASLYLKMGFYSKAEAPLKRSLEIREKALGPNHPELATGLNNLASFYESQRLYGQAEPLFQRAIEINEKSFGRGHFKTAAVLNNLAGLYASQGLHSKAKSLYLRSLAIREKNLGTDHLDTGTTINNLASLFSSQGLYGKAEPLFQKALSIMESKLGPNHPKTASSLLNLAALHIEAGAFIKAQPYLRRGIATQSKLTQRDVLFLSSPDRLAYLSGFQAAHKAALAFAFQGAGAENLALFSRLNRQGLLGEIEKRQAQLAALPGEHQQVAQELRALIRQLSSLSIKPEQRRALRLRQEELEKHLYRLLPELNPRIVDVEKVAAVLPDDGVLIEFQRYQPFDGKKPRGQQWGSERYLAMVLKPNGSVNIIDLGDAAVLDQAITTAVSTARDGLEDSGQKFELVSQLLLEPLKQATAGSKTWFVSPDGELNRLPFAAVQVPGGKGYLAEAVDLRLLTTGRELLDLQQPKPSAKSAALVVANPAYDRSGVDVSTAVAAKDRGESTDRRRRSSDLPEQLKWDPLPATAQEGQNVKALTGGSLLVQQQATTEAVKSTPAPKILHLATHAFYLPNQPQQQPEGGAGPLDQRGSRGVVRTKSLQGESPLLRSGIALAGANQPNADPQDDGYLTALELAQLSLEGTDLVVISACESGLGDLQVGEGVYGLKRAIAVAGARSSLLSLWKVDDSATAAFMESFYQRLKRGEGKTDALAATQKEFRNHPIPMWREPYVWAAFQLSGDWGPVQGL